MNLDNFINNTNRFRSEPKALYITGMRHGKTYAQEEFEKIMTMTESNSVFRTPKEANEALARKYGNRKEYNKMNMNKNIVVAIDGKYYKPSYGDITHRVGEYPQYTLRVDLNPMYMINEGPARSCLIKNVIFNPPATIVFWVDNTKTVVKSQNDEPFDPEKGLAMAIVKKVYGNKGNYFNEIKKWTDPYMKEQEEITKIFIESIIASGKTKSDDECQTK